MCIDFETFPDGASWFVSLSLVIADCGAFAGKGAAYRTGELL